MSALPVLISSSTGVVAGAGVGTGLDGLGVSVTKEPKHKSKFPLLQIRTDLNPSAPFRRTSTAPGLNIGNTNNTNNNNAAQVGNPGANNINEVQRKEPSKWQIGLERMLKKIQRRKRAPSNLIWYAAHSTESYLSGATLDTRPGGLKYEVDPDAEGLYFGHDRPPQWVVDSLQGDALFFSDDTVELMLGLRDYLIKATGNGWDIAELKEEIFPIRYSTIAGTDQCHRTEVHTGLHLSPMLQDLLHPAQPHKTLAPPPVAIPKARSTSITCHSMSLPTAILTKKQDPISY
ncbi:hypothetical protein BGZ58_010865 [Dissophora ornata]|nr:hypothetical protein BGZ58_010865 [Dissophora ornata]